MRRRRSRRPCRRWTGDGVDGQDAEALEVRAGTVRQHSSTRRGLYVRSPLREQQRMLLDSQGEVGDRVFLLHSFRSGKPDLVQDVPLLVNPSFAVVDTGGYGPRSNCDTFEFTVPELGRGRECLAVTLQAVHVNPARRERVLSNPIRLLLLDRRF